MNLTSQLKERLAFKNYFDLETYMLLKPDKIRPEMLRPGRLRLCVFKSQVDKLAPLHALLIEAVCALEFYAGGENWSTHDEEMLFNNISDKDWYKPNGHFCGGKLATEALTKLRAEVSRETE